MFSSISWAEYLTYMAIALGLYYSWWLVRYYPTLRMRRPDQVVGGPDKAWPGEKKKQIPGTAHAGGGEADRQPDQAVPVKDSPEKVSQEAPLQLPPPVGTEPEFHAALVAGEVSEKIRDLIERGAKEKMVEGELVFGLTEILSDEQYQRLINTAYYVRVNDTIRATMERTGSIPFDAERIKGLWIR
jgi:hypothetical protein